MILPTKHIAPPFSILGIGGNILKKMTHSQSVTELWEKTKEEDGVISFERFTLGLSFLFSIGVIEFDQGLLVRSNK